MSPDFHLLHVVLVERRLDVEAGRSGRSLLVLVGASLLFVLRGRDVLGVGLVVVAAVLFGEAEGHDFLEEDVGDADRQWHQVDLEVVLDGDAADGRLLAVKVGKVVDGCLLFNIPSSKTPLSKSIELIKQ